MRLRGRNVILRLPRRSDFDEWSELRTRSRAFLEPWEPVWPNPPISRREFAKTVRRQGQDARRKTGFSFFILSAHDELMGGITLSNVRYGVCQNGEIGYWMGEPFAGKGHMHDAIDTLCDFAFRDLNLHRVQAACIPGNERSERLLKKAGFEREGLLRSYLFIGGVWRDHHLYARLCGDDERSRASKGSGL
ncbi:N-acetyltransferase [Notoacmeibacter ruber]|uniref:N-acetyltransferase n=2 Tax=Notoacmeibacter ruber TaxID=2670375 RepID=A0A3L7JAS5_9HYPH|nr:GNAT family protein [Notoacmeibacter ruber]RLQ87465.1 N-acetyltransferase [Notoacmeibacter ruber]